MKVWTAKLKSVHKCFILKECRLPSCHVCVYLRGLDAVRAVCDQPGGPGVYRKAGLKVKGQKSHHVTLLTMFATRMQIKRLKLHFISSIETWYFTSNVNNEPLNSISNIWFQYNYNKECCSFTALPLTDNQL